MNIEISQQTIDMLFDLAQVSAPKEPTDADLQSAISKIQVIVSSFMEMPLEEYGKKDGGGYTEDASGERDILVVDDIGVVTYQMKVLFEKQNLAIETAKNIYNAIKLFKKHSFSYVVMDLFVSTEREGYLLLDEIKKMVIRQKLPTKIIVVTASTKGEHKLKCLNRGADKFIVKEQGWQEEILKICTEEKVEDGEDTDLNSMF